MKPAVKTALRRSFYSLLIVVGVLVALVFFVRWRTIGQWNDFKAHWEAQGEQFTIEELLPEPPPEDQNLAAHPWFINLQTEGVTADSPLAVVGVETIPGFRKQKNGASWQRCQPDDFSHWDDLQEGMSGEEIARELLSRMEPADETMDRLAVLLAERPACHYPDGWEEVITRQTEHLFAFMTFADAYAMRATLRLRTGEEAPATEDLVAILRLASLTDEAPTFVGLLVKVAIYQQLCASLWEGLRTRRFSEPSLRKLATALPAPEALGTGSLDYLRFERNAFLQIIESMEAGKQTGPGSDQPAFVKLWLASNRLALCEELQNHLLAPGGTFASRPTMVGAEAMQVSLEKRSKGLKQFTQTLAILTTPVYKPIIARTLTAEAHLNHARIAIALERHRLAHGSYPATLAALVPEFLPAVPTDLINARPIDYLIKPDGTPQLSQWGCDGDDDGARPRKDPLHGDIVWQYTIDPPLTEVEFTQKD